MICTSKNVISSNIMPSAFCLFSIEKPRSYNKLGGIVLATRHIMYAGIDLLGNIWS